MPKKSYLDIFKMLWTDSGQPNKQYGPFQSTSKKKFLYQHSQLSGPIQVSQISNLALFSQPVKTISYINTAS